MLISGEAPLGLITGTRKKKQNKQTKRLVGSLGVTLPPLRVPDWPGHTVGTCHIMGSQVSVKWTRDRTAPLFVHFPLPCAQHPS